MFQYQLVVRAERRNPKFYRGLGKPVHMTVCACDPDGMMDKVFDALGVPPKPYDQWYGEILHVDQLIEEVPFGFEEDGE
jgi:hypothetical protein